MCPCSFMKAIEEYGVPKIDLFQTVDLYEKKDIAVVTSCLFALGRTVSYQNIFLCISKKNPKSIIINSINLFSRLIATQNGQVHGWDHDQLKKTSVSSLTTLFKLEKLSLAFKLDPTKVLHKLDRIWEHPGKFCWESKYFAWPTKEIRLSYFRSMFLFENSRVHIFYKSFHIAKCYMS